MTIIVAQSSTAPPSPVFIDHVVIVVTLSRIGEPEMATATLTWDPPTFRTDTPPTPLPPDQIAGADIFDTFSVDPSVPIGSVVGAAGTFTTDVLAVGTHNFTAITRDTTGHSSASSNMASVTVAATLANPAAITNLTAVLNP